MTHENVKEPRIDEEPKQCTTKEKLGHAIGVLGHDCAYTFYSSWITPFMTNILQLPAQFMLILPTVARIFDAFTDISMGVIADKTRTKWGRFRPWILMASPLFCLFVVLSFTKPPVGITGLCIFAAIMYLVTGSIFFTATDIPFWSLPAAMTSNPVERDGIVGMTTTFSNIIIGIVGIGAPLAINRLGAQEWTSYFYTALPVGIFAVIMYMVCFKMVREHTVPADVEKFSLRLALKNIFNNQPLLCVQLANIFCLLGMMMKGSFGFYYCSYNLGNLDTMAVMNILNLVGSALGSIVFLAIHKHIGKKNCMFLIAIVYSAANIVQYIAGWGNLIIVYACSAVSFVAIGASLVCVNAMMNDTIEYGEWKTGQRNEAMITATRCFVTKCVMAVSGIAIAAVVGLTSFDPNVAVQAPDVLNAIHLVTSLLCGLIMIMAVIPLFFYKLTEKRHAEIMEELAARKAAKGE